MIKIDDKDRRILYQLDINSRQSLKSIGEKVHLQKNVVQYRIDKLVKTGVIKNFYTSINFHRLGFINLGIHIKYQYYTPEIEKEIIQYFYKSQYSWFIANVQGDFDLLVLFSVKNMNQFFNFWNNTMIKFRFYIEKANISFFTKTHYLPSSYLIKDFDNEIHIRNEIIDGGNEINIDKYDFNILKQISLNSRKPIIDIAKILNVSSTMVVNRIKILVKKQVINGYRINIDYSKLGFQLFNVKYSLKDYTKSRNIIDYVKANPHLISASEVIGDWDLSLIYYIQNYSDLHDIINDVLNHFSNSIKNRMTFSYPTIYKMDYIPNLKI